jgi:murein endopeptidase
MRHPLVVVRGPVLLVLLSLLLAAGAFVAAGAADSGVGLRQAPAPSPLAHAPAAPPAPEASPGTAPRSIALGRPFRRGRLLYGVQLPITGPDHMTWDAPLRRSPNRPWRRWGTDVLVATVLQVLAEHRAAHPGSPPILVGDLSRPTGGIFDQRFGGLGHASHQNGLDVDVYYPRKDRLPVAAVRPAQVDRILSQDLVDRFRAAGAQVIFVGPHVGLKGPRKRVVRLAHHDDHLHVRIPDPDGIGGR